MYCTYIYVSTTYLYFVVFGIPIQLQLVYAACFLFEVSIPARRATAAYGWIAWALKGPCSWWAR